MKPIKKIVFVISNISIGGAQRITLTLVEWLNKNGVDAKIVAVGISNDNYKIPKNIEVGFLGHSSNLKTLVTINKLKKYLIKEKPQIVVTMGVATCLFSVPAVRCVSGIKHIISERNDPRHFFGKTYVRKLSRLFMRTGDGFVFQTKEARDFYSQVIRDKSTIIPNPILVDNIPSAIAQEKKNYIVTMGRLTAQKNHKMLIDAFDKFFNIHPEYELHIYGAGELEMETKTYAAEKKSKDKIIFWGAYNDVLNRIKDAKIFVLSSDFEGMPNALMEAMAIGLPCISTDCPCGGPRFLINDGKNGFLTPVNNSNELANKLCELADNKILRDRIATEALNVKYDFNTEKISKLWYDYCVKVI
ncbi:glycosyltransferase [Enterococcus faecalis]|nr:MULTISPECIES: glycosyltransferase [Enterococcus]AYQ61073.1 glycosyltransferase family 4 protein [Enterococcus faecium]EOD99576.1 hypothetical protein Q9I_00239 [Enterococcus faecalis EnGen0074]EOE04514.1 hypothetical protein Q9O_01420 [Enterococcus faecalis EnGen0073]EOE08180.1 hypothetical protein Q9M_00596 [Enterococcus faecalis EnGen0058]EOJ62650.1 hypothetical protein WMQ_01604 [Enterococcus faecalis EnGen0350]